MAVPMLARWAGQHGLIKIALSRAAKKGDLQAILITDRAARENPFPIYEQIRARGAIWRGQMTYLAPSHRAASAVLRSDVFQVGFNISGVPAPLRKVMLRQADHRVLGPIDPPSLLAINPPEHSRLRQQVTKVFTPRAIAALEPRVQQIADELLDDLADREVVDLVGSYAGLLPVTVIAEILGVPVELRDTFLTWGNAAAPALDVGLSYRRYRRSESGIRGLTEWMREHIQRLRRDPGQDLLSRLITVEDDGVRMSDVELMATAGLLLAAGFETTVNLIASGTQLLLSNPDQLETLRSDPSHWDNAVNEILRYESPVQNTARYAAQATEICGIPVPQNGFVSVLIGAANRDPEVFSDPARFDVTRANAREHLAFSAGVHYCIGASLARAEGRIGLRTLFERYPKLASAGAATRRETKTLRGYQTLPIALRP
jgi:cytochrome P450